jgi:hypothetical protein
MGTPPAPCYGLEIKHSHVEGLKHNLNTTVTQPCNRQNKLGGMLKTDLPTAEKLNKRDNCKSRTHLVIIQTYRHI